MDYSKIIQEAGVPLVIVLFLIREGFNFLEKLWPKKGNGVEGQLKLMSENHLNAIERAILDQTRLFQEDHNKNLEVLYKIQAGVENLNKK